MLVQDINLRKDADTDICPSGGCFKVTTIQQNAQAIELLDLRHAEETSWKVQKQEQNSATKNPYVFQIHNENRRSTYIPPSKASEPNQNRQNSNTGIPKLQSDYTLPEEAEKKKKRQRDTITALYHCAVNRDRR